MGELAKATQVAFMQAESADPFRKGTVSSVDGTKARVAMATGEVTAGIWHECSVGDRVLVACHGTQFDIIGRLGG